MPFLRIGRPASPSASGHNGGRSTINPSDLVIGEEYPFLDLLKSATEWTEWGAPGGTSAEIVEPSTLNADGYPTSIAIGGPVKYTYAPTQQERPGRYVLTWKGVGKVRIASFSFSYYTGYSSDDLTSSTADGGRVEFVPAANSRKMFFGIETIGSPIITDMKLYHIDDEPDVLAGRVFGNKFKERIAELRPGVIRFLSWPDNNKTNVTSWLTRKPVGYHSYGAYEARAASYCNPASNGLSGRIYSFAAPSQNASTGAAFSLVDKCMVHIKFTSASPVSTLTGSTNSTDTISLTSHGLSVDDQVWVNHADFGNEYVPAFVVNVPNSNSIKLSLTQGGPAIIATTTGPVTVSPAIFIDVGSTGAKIVRSEYGTGLSDGSNSYPVDDSRALATLIYDADLDAWVKHGGDVGNGRTGIINGVPPELMLQLCIETGAHPYFVAPVFGCDPMTDYIPELAAMCRDSGPSWMVPRIEGPNELWNTAPGFYSATYAKIKSLYHWPVGGADVNAIYGKIISTVGQAVNAVFGGTVNTQTKYQVMCGVRTFAGAGAAPGGVSECDQRMTSASYVGQAAAAQSLTWSGGTINFTKSAGKDWVTHGVVANYWRPSDYLTEAESTASDTFAACEVTASISGTTMTVSSTAFGGTTGHSGKQLFGSGIPDGVTIVGGSHPTWTISEPLTVQEERIILANWASGVQDTYAATSNSGSGAFTLSENLNFYTNWKAWLISHGVMKMSCYEGGYSPDMLASSIEGTNAIDQLRGLSKRAAINETYIQTNYNDFVGLTDDDFVAEFPSGYFAGTVPISNVWSMLDNIHTTKREPIFEGIKAFNH